MIKNNPSVDGSTYTGPDGDEVIESTPRRQGGQSAQRNQRSNSTESHENGSSSQSSAASGSAPTDGARDTTEGEAPKTPKKPTAAEIEAAIDERLCATDDQYKSDKEKLELLEKVNKGFGRIGMQGVFKDEIVEGWDFQAVLDDPDAPASAKEAARILLDHPDLWKELAHKVESDDRATFNDLKTMLEELRTKQKEKKDAIRTEVKNELNEAAGIKSDGSAATGGSGATGSSEPPKDKAASLNEPPFVQPPLSSKTGLEGAAENINNTLTAISDASHKISIELANPNLDPNDKAKLQNRFNDLQLLQQMLTAMYTQIQQAMSNLMKMYSDAAANAVRNMR